MLTKQEAQMIIEIHEIDKFMKNEEEVDCLKINNPTLLDAYKKLLKIAKKGKK